MVNTFYEQAKLLDPCRESNQPSNEQVELVYSLIKDERFARYFFDQLDNPVWGPILEKRGYFQKAPEPIEVEKGSFRLPLWPAANYLVKVAKRIPDTLLAIIRKIETENSRVQEVLLDALAELPSEDSRKVLEKISAWSASRFTDFIPVKYGVLIDKWLSEGFSIEAVLLFEKLITPVLPGVGKDSMNLYASPLRFSSDQYWIREVIQKHYSALLNANCEGLFTAYDRQTQYYIELAKEVTGADVEAYTGFRWRLDIPFLSSSPTDLDAYDILIDGLRDALMMLCEKLPEKGREKLTSYINGEHVILQRLTLFSLRNFGQQYPELLERALGTRDFFENLYFHDEYKGLLRYQFGNSSDAIKQQVVSWILEGPLDANDRAFRHAMFENREVNSADRQYILEKWRLEHLALVSDYLSEGEKSIFNDLIEKYSKPDITEKPKISTSVTWGGLPSPIPANELKKMSFDELTEVIINYNEPSNSFFDPGESLAQIFGSVVQNEPVKYRDYAYRLIDSRIRFVFVYHFLNGISEAIKSSKEKLTDGVIALCESVIEENEEQAKRLSNRDEPDLLACQLEVGRLVENVVRSDDPYLTGDLLSRVRAILFILSEHYDPKVNPETSSLDPFTQSLNSVRGVAMHGIMHYLLYVDRQRKQIETQEVHKPNIEPDVQEVLQNKLDITKDSSLAVHSVFGAYLPQLQYLDRDWVRQNLEKIFPEANNLSNYWQASWDAYIFSSNVYGDVFELLVHHYQRALQLLSMPAKDKKIATPGERLSQHIMFLYINGLTDFGHKNRLLDLFFTNAPDQIRSSAVFWLNKVIESRKPSTQDELWIKLWHLWQTRVEFSVGAAQPNNLSLEITNYMRWLPNVPVDLGFLKDILQKSIGFLNDGFSVQLMASFAAKHCEKYPVEAVSLIYDAIKSAKEPWWAPEEKDEETILKTALASGHSNAKDMAIELINIRGEQGDFRWKDLLIEAH